MADYLVIVESPGKLKSIKKFLGSRYAVAASVGHVRDLPKSKLGVDIENNFEPNYITIRGKADVIKELKKQAKKVKKIFLATDPDREGEAISWHLANLLDIDENTMCRVTFNEITANAVKKAVKNPGLINMDLVNAQQARRVLDRVVGYKISPLLWKKVKKGLSAGRVQSVALKLICEREREIEEFEPKEYWNITASLQKQGLKIVFAAKYYGSDGKKNALTCEDDVKKVTEDIKGKPFQVKSVVYGEKKRNPSPPFITSTLQQEASRKLNFRTAATMSVAQKLYEGIDIPNRGTVGLITYMRTDSLRVSEEAMTDVRTFIKEKYGNENLPDKPRRYKAGKQVQDAHEAIRPTYFDLPPEKLEDILPKEQYKLYKLIWDRFLASQMATALYDTVNAEITAGRQMFKAAGSKIKFKGFTVLYTEGTDETGTEEYSTIPALTVGETLTVKKIEPQQLFTQPPLRFSEASLIKIMEENGIGRPGTYSSIISTILSRGYVNREKKILVPTELGGIVNELMLEHFTHIVDVSFTADMERQLDEVGDGRMLWKQVIADFYGDFAKELEKAEDEIGKIEIPPEVSDVLCDKCGRNMVVKLSKYGKFLACPGFPDCRNIKQIVVETGVNCPKCDGRILQKKSKKGKYYYGCENYQTCDFVLFDMPLPEKCPDCGSVLVYKDTKKGRTIKCSAGDCKYIRKEEIKEDGKEDKKEK